MDLLFYRYRHLAVLLVAIVAQLGLLAYQVRNDQDVRLIRVWSVGAVTPLARLLDTVRSGSSTFIDDYFLLLGVREENKRLQDQLNGASLELQHLRAELATAERAEALALFQKESPQKFVNARVLMNTTGNIGSGAATTVFVDVGSAQGIQPGMAVITPDGIVGKVIQVYGPASTVLLMNDPLFAAGVVSQKGHVQGTLKGQGSRNPIVDYIQNEQTVEDGEWFYTSGNDFVFPRGLKVGVAEEVKNGTHRKEVRLRPSGFKDSLEEVMIITSGVHAPIPEAPAEPHPVSFQMAPYDASGEVASQAAQGGPLATDADRVMEQLRSKSGKAAPVAILPTSPETTPEP